MYWQQGNLLLKGTRPSDAKGERHFLMEVLDVSTNKKLWERNSLNELPWAFYSRVGHTVSVVVANYDDMKAEAKEDGALNAKLKALADEDRRKASYIIEVLDDATGKELGKLLVDTGNLSFRVERATTIGDLVLVTDSVPRTLIYSLRKGELKGTVFGIARAISADGRLALLEDRDGKADLYDLGSLAPLVHYEFPSRLVHAQFLNEGTTLAVLTGDQTIYRLKFELPSKNAAK
jgi:hypothetical protein